MKPVISLKRAELRVIGYFRAKTRMIVEKLNIRDRTISIYTTVPADKVEFETSVVTYPRLIKHLGRVWKCQQEVYKGE